MRHVAVEVGGAFPDAHRREVRRLRVATCHWFMRVVRDAVQPDLAVAPRLRAGPLDAALEVRRLARRERIDPARRAAGTTRVDAHARVPVGHPFLGVDDLPVLVAVARPGGHVGMCSAIRSHALGIAVLKRKPLRVRAVGHDRRIRGRRRSDGRRRRAGPRRRPSRSVCPSRSAFRRGFHCAVRVSCGRLRPPPCGLRLPAMTCVSSRNLRFASWPGSTQPSTSFERHEIKDVDARHKPVLRPAKGRIRGGRA